MGLQTRSEVFSFEEEGVILEGEDKGVEMLGLPTLESEEWSGLPTLDEELELFGLTTAGVD